MILIRHLALVLCLVFSHINYSNAQVDTTGNIVVPTTTSSGSTWTGAVYQDQLTCWAPGGPGYCGPGAIVRPGDNINFSYGSTYIYQQHHINTILPSSTGLQVNGYNFSFTAKNGNGWDNGMTDQLVALVRFWDNTGGKAANNLLYGTSYDLNSKFNWTNFSYSETFNKAIPAPDIGLVQYGFIGKDNNGWAGPYGPEVNNVKFSVKYSVDPCATNVLSSPSCPGYLDALAKITIAPVLAVSAEYTTSPPPEIIPTPTAISPTVQYTQPTATSAPTTAASAEKQATGSTNVGFALNLVSKNSTREKALAQQVVTASIAEAQAAGDKAQQLGTATATTAAAVSMENTNSSLQASLVTTKTTSAISAVPQQVNSSIPQPAQSFASTQTQQQTGVVQLLAPTSVDSQQSAKSFSIFESQSSRAQEVEIPAQASNFLTDRNNPLREIIEATPQQQAQPEQKASSAVNRNVAPNELATGVSLEKLATQPTGYASYTNFALKDANFYAPKDIYPKQTTVDNARALRQLSSDRLHQQMVQDQYR